MPPEMLCASDIQEVTNILIIPTCVVAICCQQYNVVNSIHGEYWDIELILLYMCTHLQSGKVVLVLKLLSRYPSWLYGQLEVGDRHCSYWKILFIILYGTRGIKGMISEIIRKTVCLATKC